ncbi:hypothetical protein BIS06_22215, partial [Halomonas sp. BBD48]|nr:hypothetical protein [Halomonas sp. BBD48]
MSHWWEKAPFSVGADDSHGLLKIESALDDDKRGLQYLAVMSAARTVTLAPLYCHRHAEAAAMSSHLLSVDSLSRDHVDHLLRVASRMEPIAQRRKITRV